MELTDEQKLATDRFLRYPISIITGGPGSGKTTLIKHLILGGDEEQKHLIVASTGCAASRIEQATGREAHVISKVDFSATLINEYTGCVLVIDEASMASVEMVVVVLSTMKPIKLVVLGDEKQLTCISSTPFLQTMLQCQGMIPITRLTRNLRQLTKDSGLLQTIMTMGTEHWKGPVLDESLTIKACSSDQQAIQQAAGEFDENSQMLAFVNGVCSSLNQATQHKNVPRVVCTQNSYRGAHLRVPNGMSGVITWNGDIQYDNGFVDKKNRHGRYETKHMDARCLTVHKAQGSEYDKKGLIVVTLWRGGTPLELTFTALSRFKNKVTIYGTHAAIEAAFAGKFALANVDQEVVSLMKERGKIHPLEGGHHE